VIHATLFEAAAKEQALYGVLLASQTAFFAFLFSDLGPLSHEARLQSRFRLNIGSLCMVAFFVGIASDILGLAVSPPQIRLAVTSAGCTTFLAFWVGAFPLAADISDPRRKARGRNILVGVCAFSLIGLIVLQGLSIPTHTSAEDGYSALPPHPDSPNAAKAERYAVVICLPPGIEKRCTRRSAHAHIFRLSSLFHEDVRGGADYWDYSFTQPGSNLRFLYRKNPSQGSHWGLVRGGTDKDVDFSKNKIYGLPEFGYTDLAQNVLEPQADDQGMAWAKSGGLATQTNVQDNSSSLPGALLMLVIFTIVLVGLLAFCLNWLLSRRKSRRGNPSNI